jgi:hypothetical protein
MALRSALVCFLLVWLFQYSELATFMRSVRYAEPYLSERISCSLSGREWNEAEGSFQVLSLLVSFERCPHDILLGDVRIRASVLILVELTDIWIPFDPDCVSSLPSS